MIDLRSDILTIPTNEMLETILLAKLGDDGRKDAEGRGEDPTVNELEDLASYLTGKESAAIFSSGTLANTAALLTYCAPGDMVMVDSLNHIYRSEKVAFDQRFGQLIPMLYPLTKSGKPDLEAMREILQKNPVKLIVVENTHNFAGGVCLDETDLFLIRHLADEFHVKVHLDGTRLFNAAASTGISAKKLCSHVDSVMFCLSKGLGAPLGSLLCGSQEFMRNAGETRKLLGANMRQAGVMAAPGIYALQNHLSNLLDDHEHAKMLAENLRDLRKSKVQETVESNIVMLDVEDTGMTAEEYCGRAMDLGLLIRPVFKNTVRLVFYKGITRLDTLEAIRIIKELDESLSEINK